MFFGGVANMKKNIRYRRMNYSSCVSIDAQEPKEKVTKKKIKKEKNTTKEKIKFNIQKDRNSVSIQATKKIDSNLFAAIEAFNDLGNIVEITCCVTSNYDDIYYFIEGNTIQDYVTGDGSIKGLVWVYNALLQLEELLKSLNNDYVLRIDWTDNKRKSVYRKRFIKNGWTDCNGHLEKRFI